MKPSNICRMALVIALMYSASAFAVGIGNDNPGSTGGDVTNTLTSNPVAFANGGAGGAGGNATGVGVGLGGTSNVTNSNSNINSNSNANHNSNLNAQGQQQSATNTNTSSNLNAQGQLQGQGQHQNASSDQNQHQNASSDQGQSQSTDNANNSAQNVTVNGDTTVYKAADIPVASAYAPANFPTAPCMGASSGGVQGMSFGVSVGSSWTSEECLILETARSFEEAHYTADAMHVRCQAKYAKSAPSCKAIAEGEPVADKSEPVAKQATVSPEQYNLSKLTELGTQLY